MERLRKNNNNKKSKIAAVPTQVPLKALYLVGGGLIVPPNENAVCTAAILDFLSRHLHNKVVNHFRKVLRNVTTLIAWKFASSPLHFMFILV